MCCAGYNWEEMEKDGYLWWRQRLSHMAQYFTAYRVDHILAFFRIFQIPEKHVTGALGYFKPSRALARTGLENVGLWDIDRLCEPYMTTHSLKDELGDDADEVLGSISWQMDPGSCASGQRSTVKGLWRKFQHLRAAQSGCSRCAPPSTPA